MKLQKKQYILECWNCKSKIIYSHSDCNYDSRYHSYELKCPNCQQRYSTERRELFHREYKTEDNITIDQLTNNWNELEEWLIDYRTNMDNPDIYEEGIIDCLDEILDKMKEIKDNDKSIE